MLISKSKSTLLKSIAMIVTVIMVLCVCLTACADQEARDAAKEAKDAAMAAAADSLEAEPAELPYLLYTDKKTALSLNRLNGGLVVVDEGVLSYKDRLTSTIW